MTSVPDDIDQGALARAWEDLRHLSTHWWRFRIPAACLTVAFAIKGAFLSSDASPVERGALAVGGTLGGGLLLGTVAFAILLLTTPIRQRNEMRNAVRASSLPPGENAPALVQRYSAWVQMVRATLPEFPRSRGLWLVSDWAAGEKRRADRWAAVERYRESKDEAERAARREYHEQFRESLMSLFDRGRRDLADNPQTITDFEEIERAIVRLLAARRQMPPDEAVRRVLRRSEALLLGELREGKGTVEAALERQTFWERDGGPKTGRWTELGSDLIELGLADVHTVVSIAYSRLEALDGDALSTWSAMEAHYDYDPPPGMRPSIKGSEAALRAALEAIAAAEVAVEGSGRDQAGT